MYAYIFDIGFIFCAPHAEASVCRNVFCFVRSSFRLNVLAKEARANEGVLVT